ncbi:hypothetical protein GCM10012276_18720 [Nocardioides deserti]|nr:hypothetical protein GCM10012276_18720 [Nocardioides deserti]
MAGRGLVLVAALAGLLAMHGLSDHALGVGHCASPAALITTSPVIGSSAGHVDGDPDAPAVASALAAVLASSFDLPAPAIAPAATAHGVAQGTSEEAAQALGALLAAAVDLSSVAGSDGPDNGLAGLCLAVLAAAFAALLVGVTFWRRWWRLTRRQFAALSAIVAELGASVRVPAGPTSASLCVFRC